MTMTKLFYNLGQGNNKYRRILGYFLTIINPSEPMYRLAFASFVIAEKITSDTDTDFVFCDVGSDSTELGLIDNSSSLVDGLLVILVPFSFGCLILLLFYMMFIICFCLPEVLIRMKQKLQKFLIHHFLSDVPSPVIGFVYHCYLYPYVFFILLMRAIFMHRLVSTNILYVIPLISILNRSYPGQFFPLLSMEEIIVFPFILGFTLASWDNISSMVTLLISNYPSSYYLSKFTRVIGEMRSSKFLIIRTAGSASFSSLLFGKTALTSAARAAIFVGSVAAATSFYNGHLDRVQRGEFHRDEMLDRKEQRAKAWENYDREKAEYDRRPFFSRKTPPVPPTV